MPSPPLPNSTDAAPGADALHAELRALIASSRQRLAGAVNAELTRLYWAVGERLSSQVLGGERARYGDKMIARVGERLAQEFGRGFEAKNPCAACCSLPRPLLSRRLSRHCHDN